MSLFWEISHKDNPLPLVGGPNLKTPNPLPLPSNTLVAALEKYETGSSSMSSSTSFITVFLPVLPLDYEGILPVTAPLTCYVLILENLS